MARYSSGNSSPTKSDEIGEIPKEERELINRTAIITAQAPKLTQREGYHEDEDAQQGYPVVVARLAQRLKVHSVGGRQLGPLLIVNVGTETGERQRHEYGANDQQWNPSDRVDQQSR